MQFPKFTLVLGGAASGKSSYAEQLAHLSGRPKSYLATAQAFDDEMREKIKQHQSDRGPDWATIEVPRALSDAVLNQPNENVILVDCLTLWLTNLMLSDADCDTATTEFFAAIAAKNGPIIAVSNEVGHSVIPETSLGRRFQRAQGRLNAQAAAKADLVVMVTAGLPQILKGQAPEFSA